MTMNRQILPTAFYRDSADSAEFVFGFSEGRGLLALDAEPFLICAVALALDRSIQTSVGERVLVQTVLVLRVVRQEAAHAFLGVERQLDAEVLVDAPHHADLVADELREMHDEYRRRVERQVIARRDCPLHAVGEPRRPLGADGD